MYDEKTTDDELLLLLPTKFKGNKRSSTQLKPNFRAVSLYFAFLFVFAAALCPSRLLELVPVGRIGSVSDCQSCG
jgi:hypothetical protein